MNGISEVPKWRRGWWSKDSGWLYATGGRNGWLGMLERLLVGRSGHARAAGFRQAAHSLHRCDPRFLLDLAPQASIDPSFVCLNIGARANLPSTDFARVIWEEPSENTARKHQSKSLLPKRQIEFGLQRLGQAMTKQASIPKVSIMMIAYNQERFIAAAIESAIAQDYPNLEIIVSDDASSDRTPDIIRGYARRFPDLVVPVLNQVNRGITANSNAGLRACTGDLVAFIDGDDLFVPGKIAAQVKWFDGHPERTLCGHLIEVFHEDGSQPATLFPPKLLIGRGGLRAVDHILFSKISMMVRADRIPAHGFDESLKSVSDLLFPIEILDEDGVFGFIEGIYARARRHDRNITSQPFKLLGDYAHHFDLVEQRFPQYAAICRRARTRRLHYDVGVLLLSVGRKREARSKFLEAVRREPGFAKAWIRTAQSFL